MATLSSHRLVVDERAANVPALSCETLSYKYPQGTLANDSIQLAIAKGELFCLIGPNGAGKTTLVRQITGHLRPSSGAVFLFGHDVNANLSLAGSLLGIIPQNPGLFDMLTVEEHLRYFGPLRGLSRLQTLAQTDRIINTLSLGPIRRRSVHQLSGGERRQVLIGLALLSDPPILVLDEPTVGLDPEVRRSLWKVIDAQRNSGKTVLLTTHYLDEAERLATRIGILIEGRLFFVGSLSQLYAQVGRSVCVSIGGRDLDGSDTKYYFDSPDEAQAFVMGHNFAHYSVGRVSLEDIYLRLIEHSNVKGLI